MKEREIQQLVYSFIKTNGYDHLQFEKVWNSLPVYSIWKNEDEDAMVGYPTFVIIENGKVRFSTSKETTGIMGFSCISKGSTQNGFII